MSKEKKTKNKDEIVVSLDQFAVPGAIIVAGIIIAVAIFFADKSKDNSIDASDTENIAGEEVDADSQNQFPDASTDIGDAPYLGDKETAKVAIVEYSDYLCGYCQRHVDETYPAIVEKYIESGEAIYVYREFSIHGEIADAQAMGGKCVFDLEGLDTYLEYHKKAFMLDSIDAVYEVAENVGADIRSCVESDKYRDAIDTDYQAGADAGVQGTPGFVVGLLDNDGNVVGKLIAGAYPFDAFEEVINSLLAE
ncbi:DsbA family protein [bacterium]|nr:DsbA family protein [bacterium]